MLHKGCTYVNSMTSMLVHDYSTQVVQGSLLMVQLIGCHVKAYHSNNGS